MRKNRWSNLFGDILAIGTVSTVALSANTVRNIRVSALTDYIFLTMRQAEFSAMDQRLRTSCLRFSAKIKKIPITVCGKIVNDFKFT